jgi:hypothetical protein
MFNFARVFVSAEAFFSFHFFIPGWRRGQIFEVKLKCMVIRRTEQTQRALARALFPLISKKWQMLPPEANFFRAGKSFCFLFQIFSGAPLSKANRG